MTKKQSVRQKFRLEVFSRDKYKCVICEHPVQDAHHITNRKEMPNGGYVKENGISLCEDCHIEAEKALNGEDVLDIFQPENLYLSINSSKELAITKSKLLK